MTSQVIITQSVHMLEPKKSYLDLKKKVWLRISEPPPPLPRMPAIPGAYPLTTSRCGADDEDHIAPPDPTRRGPRIPARPRCLRRGSVRSSPPPPPMAYSSRHVIDEFTLLRGWLPIPSPQAPSRRAADERACGRVAPRGGSGLWARQGGRRSRAASTGCRRARRR